MRWLLVHGMYCLNWAGSLRNLKNELRTYKIGTAALQEIRWKAVGIMDTADSVSCILVIGVTY